MALAWSALLATVALLAAVALLPPAAPAQAQTTTVWSATLTPGALTGAYTGFIGCNTGTGAPAPCSNTAVLSEDEFMHDSTDYTVIQLFVESNGDFQFVVHVPPPFTAATAALTLVVDNTRLDPADGTVDLPFGNITWTSTGVTLTVGTPVDVSLVSGTVSTNTAPTVATEILDQTATTGAAFSFAFPAATFADTDAGDTLTYMATLDDDSMLPSWLSFDAATRTFSGTPTAAETVSVKVTASDASDSVSDTFDIVVGLLPPDTTFISNSAQLTSTISFLIRATAFTTGSNSGGYGLSSVDVYVGIRSPFNPLVEIYEDNAGAPGTLHATLGDPATVTGNSANTFTATNTTLSATTTYWLVTRNSDSTNGQGFRVNTTTNATADTGAATGWSIGNARYKSDNSDATWDSTNRRIIFTIRGTLGTVTNATPTVANAIQDQTATAGTAFSYQVPAATFADADDDTLTYAATLADDTELPSWLSFDAATRTFSGTPTAAETVSVKVTASDASDSVSDTFDIVVSAATVVSGDVLISNINQSARGINHGFGNEWAHGFVTGSNSTGYNLTSIELKVLNVFSAGISFSLWSANNSDQPDSQIFDFVNPADILTATGTLSFMAPSNTELLKDTRYFIRIDNLTGANTSGSIEGTTSIVDDTGGAPGWSIDDANFYKQAGAGAWRTDAGTCCLLKFKVNGSAKTGGTLDNAPTVATEIPNQTATTGAAFSYQVPDTTFTDADSDTLTYAATLADDTALPAWLSFTPATRTFSGTPTTAETVSVKVTASDASDSVSDTFDIVVGLPPGTAMTLVSNANQSPPSTRGHTLDRSQAFTTSAGATLSSVEIISEDAEGDEVAVSLCTVDSSNHPTSDCTVLTAPSSFAIGTLVFTAPDGTTLAANTTYSLLLTSPNDDYVLLAATSSDDEDAGGATGWSIADSFITETSPNVWAVSTRAFLITIKGTLANNAPTVATEIPNQTAMSGTAFSYEFPATTFNDADSDTLTYTATLADDTPLPAWLSFSAATRTFSGTPTAAETVSVKVTASDASDSVSDSFDIVVSAAVTGICSRTAEVQTALLDATSRTTCADVTAADLASVTSLTVNNYSGTVLDPADFAGLTGLTNLLFGGSPQLTTVPDNAFAGVTALTLLDFNSLVTVTMFAEDAFSGLTALENLNLSGNDLTTLDEDIFDGLTSLRILNLSFTSLTTLAADIFNGLTALEEIDLSFSSNMAALDEDTFDGLTALHTLDLSFTALTTLDADIFDGLTALRLLSLSGNRLTTLDADIFDGLTALSRLELQGNRLTALDADIFDGLTALIYVYLSANLLTTLDADIFDGLTLLQEISLDRNSLDTLDADIFDGLTALQKLQLQDNRLTALHADIFDGLTVLELLDLNCNYFTALDFDIFDPFAATLTSLDLRSDSFTTPPTDAAIRAKFTNIDTVFTGSWTCDRVTVSPTSLTVTEGATGTLSVALRSLPTDDVTLAISSDNPDVTVTPTTALTFTVDNWDTAQTVTVSAAEDTDQADESATLILNPDGDGNKYPFVFSTALTVTVTDDDGTAVTGICSRTAEVQTAILDVTGRATCSDVTAADLVAVTSLPVSNYSGTSLDPADFAGLTGLTSLEIDDSPQLTTVPNNAFAGLTALTTLNFWFFSLTTLGEDAFAGLTVLTSLDLNFDDSLAALDAEIFDGLTALEHLDLSRNLLTTLDADIFDGLTALSTLTLQDNLLTTLDEDIFEDLTDLETLYLTSNLLTTLNADIFDGLTALDTLDLGHNGLTTLDADIFDDLTALRILGLSVNGLTTLDADIFDDTAMETLGLDSNLLTTLDADLFDGLTALNTLYLDSNLFTTLDADLFDGLTALTTLELQDNRLTALDADIFDGITLLERLDLECNYFTALDLDIFNPFAATLTYLDLMSDSFTTPPVESAIRAKFPMITDVLIGVTPCLRVTVSPTSLTVTEGATGTYTVALRAQPSGDVMVAISSDNPDVTVAPTTPLTFTAANWDTAQMVTVSAAQDPDQADEAATLILDPDGNDYDFVISTVLTVTVTDDDGTAVNNAPTVATEIPNQTAMVGAAFSYQVPAATFTDADSDTLTYAATLDDGTALPSWLSFAAATRTFSGTPMAAAAGTVSVKVTASDASDSVSDTFDIVVSLPPDTSPTLVSNAGQGDTLSSGVTIDRAQAFTTSAGGTLSSVEIISADSEGDDATVSLCTTNSSGQPTSSCRDLTAPSSFARGTLVFTAPADTALTANTTYSLVITSPGDDSLFLSYTMSDNEDTGGATGWSIANVHDSKNTANEWYIVGTALRITIKGTLTASSNNAPTVATAILDQTATTGTAFSYQVPPATFTDADSDTLTYTATLADDTALPSWLSFAPATRTFSGTPQAADVGTVAVKVTASDGNGESVSDSFDIVVSVAMDTTGPRVASIVRQNPTSSPTNADSLTWRVTFSEAVSNVNAADFAVSGTTATVTAVAAVSGVTGAYDVSASGGNLAALNATVTLAIAASHNIEDGASNALSNTAPTGTNDNSYVVDNTAPTVTISGVPATSDAPFTATFTFPEAVTGFAVGDITLGNATASSFTVTSTTVYTALVTPTAAGAVTVDVPANAAQDAAGNGNTAATRASSAYTGSDTRGVTVSATVLTVTEGSTGAYTVVLDSQPTANVTVTPSRTGSSDVTFSPATLTFTALNWNTVQPVTVTAAQDSDAVDDSATISHAVTGGDYVGVTVESVVVTVNDDESVDTVPGVPTDLSASSGGNTRINLSWTAPGDDGGSPIIGYKIEVSPDGNANWTELVATGNTTTTYAHIGLAVGTTRHYRVSAINSAGAGDPSNIDDATVIITTVTLRTQSIPEGIGTAAVLVTLNQPAGDPLSVPWYTLNGDAVSPGDYTAGGGQLIIPSGATSATISITIIDDADAEATETVLVLLSPGEGYVLGGSGATLSILDDDGDGPAPIGATVNGTTVVLTYNKPLDGASTPSSTAFHLRVADNRASVDEVSVNGSEVTLTLASPVPAGQTVSLDYTQPMSDPIQDGSAHKAQSFTRWYLVTDSTITGTGGSPSPASRPISRHQPAGIPGSTSHGPPPATTAVPPSPATRSRSRPTATPTGPSSSPIQATPPPPTRTSAWPSARPATTGCPPSTLPAPADPPTSTTPLSSSRP